MCIKLYSQNPKTAFKIRFWVFTPGLWRAGSSEHRVIPCKMMKRVWKYPLNTKKGVKVPPWKIANWEPWWYIVENAFSQLPSPSLNNSSIQTSLSPPLTTHWFTLSWNSKLCALFFNFQLPWDLFQGQSEACRSDILFILIHRTSCSVQFSQPDQHLVH